MLHHKQVLVLPWLPLLQLLLLLLLLHRELAVMLTMVAAAAVTDLIRESSSCQASEFVSVASLAGC